MAQLDWAARNWTPGRRDRDREQLVDVPAKSWAGLLGKEAPGD
ncbi:hypothetical protein ABZY09_31210 [Streptomyces sp. NPDC002928]